MLSINRASYAVRHFAAVLVLSIAAFGSAMAQDFAITSGIIGVEGECTEYYLRITREYPDDEGRIDKTQYHFPPADVYAPPRFVGLFGFTLQRYYPKLGKWVYVDALKNTLYDPPVAQQAWRRVMGSCVERGHYSSKWNLCNKTPITQTFNVVWTFTPLSAQGPWQQPFSGASTVVPGVMILKPFERRLIIDGEKETELRQNLGISLHCFL